MLYDKVLLNTYPPSNIKHIYRRSAIVIIAIWLLYLVLDMKHTYHAISNVSTYQLWLWLMIKNYFFFFSPMMLFKIKRTCLIKRSVNATFMTQNGMHAMHASNFMKLVN